MRKDVEGHGVHIDDVNLSEVRIGDSVTFPTRGETKRDKKAFIIGWEHLADLPQEAAEDILMHSFPESVFNQKGTCASSGKMQEWEIGFGVATEMSLKMPYDEHIVIICKTAKGKYELLRSREGRQTDRFS